jgi:basic amino acid/polyamine antiporter, APA family
LIGKPIPSDRAIHERLGRVQALAVLSSDALSSVAHGPEQVFLQLMLAGYAALTWGVAVGIAIAALMVIVGLSYRQTIRGYPSGGGSYIVAKDNLGTLPGLDAASSLLLDYVLTVAVSVSAGVAAITSAFPSLFDDRVAICLFVILVMMIVNLRGVRDTGAIFAAPTYLFIIAIYVLVGVGAHNYVTSGGAVPPLPRPPLTAVEGLSLFIILRAFASGCSAMTGLEAISNGVPAFKRPEAENARATLSWMVGILVTMFLGVMFIAIVYQAVPKPDGSETMISMLARWMVGSGPLYFYIQATTALILILGANTSYADFPPLTSLLARDRFLPKQFTFRGDRLAFTTGISVLSLFSAILIVAFGGITDAPIPLYAIGVFISFTLSQSGMIRHWLKLRGSGWRTSAAINTIGAVATGSVAIVITTAKFVSGAWIATLLIPSGVLAFLWVYRHYESVWKQLSVSDMQPDPLASAHRVGHRPLIVSMGNVNKATLESLRYALSISSNVTVVHISDSPEDAERFEQKLNAWWPRAHLVTIQSPFRYVVSPLIAYIDSIHEGDPTETLTVVIPEFVVRRWWQQILHNQTALRLKTTLLLRAHIAVTNLPYHLTYGHSAAPLPHGTCIAPLNLVSSRRTSGVAVEPETAVPPVTEHRLRRVVGPWGSFTWGYADVGADVYVALGLVMAAAQGATNVAFLFAGLVYVCVGLAYTELAAAYPFSGGGQFYVLRGLGDLLGFVAGWAVLLDFTIDISLFALSSVGYVSFFLPFLRQTAELNAFGLTFAGTQPLLIALATLLVIALTTLNVVGVRESSTFNGVLGALDIISESTLIFFGFLFAFNGPLLVYQMETGWPDTYRLAYGASLAIISFVGLESISQASQETLRPSTVVPRTSIALILTVLIYALAFSNLGLGMLPWQSIAAHSEHPIAWIASHIPVIGIIAGPYVAGLGATLVLISSNAGVFGASRITYSMGRYHLLPSWFNYVHPRFRTPVRSLLVFSGVALLELWGAGLSKNALDTLGNMYAFGAAAAYMLVFVSLLVLRVKDPWTPRPFRVPLNVRIGGEMGSEVELPIVGILGFLGIGSILFMVVLTHTIGRIAGPAWILLGLGLYVLHRRWAGLPVLGSTSRDWRREQIEVYCEAGEPELAEELVENLQRRDRLAATRGGLPR